MDPLTPSSYLYKRYKEFSVSDQYILNVTKFVHKYANKRLPYLFHEYFYYNSIDYPNTRQRNNLVVPRIVSEQGSKTIMFRGACIWNEMKTKFKTLFPKYKIEEVSLKQNIFYYRDKCLKILIFCTFDIC